MVSRIVNLLNKEFKSINQAAIILGFFTLVSQVLALVRDRSFAHYLGPSEGLDIYYAAFKIPDFLFVSVASLASITVLLPFLVEKIGIREDGELNGGSESARKFISDVYTVFLLVMIVVSVLVFFFMPTLSKLIAPGFTANELKELVSISRIMLLSPILLGLSNLFGSVTQMFKKFFVFAISPVFYNLGIIFGVIFLYPILGIKGLALGVILGAFLHLMIQFPVLAREKFLPKISFNIDWIQIKKVTQLSLPRTLGLSLNSLALLFIIAIASKMGEGSISIFQFAINFQNVPLGIIGVSYSVAAFPTLARYFSGDNMKGFVEYIGSAARQIIFWSMPVMFLFIVLRAQIIRVILGTGSFSWDDTRLTAAALALFSISIVGQSLILLFTRGFYASGNTKRPLLINLFSSVFTVVFCFIFVYLFNYYDSFRFFFESLLRIQDLKNTQIVMLPLAYSLGAILNVVLLYRSFKKDFNIKGQFLTRPFLQIFSSAFFVGYVTYLMLDVFDNKFDINTFWGIFGQGFVSGVIGLVVGFFILKIIKNKELENLLEVLKIKKIFKKDVVQPEQEQL